MGKIDFLNNLASKKFKYDLGAGVPPLHLYPEIDINELLSVFSKSSSINKFQRRFYATQFFKHSDWLKILSSQS